jgi:hypothetical protein
MLFGFLMFPDMCTTIAVVIACNIIIAIACITFKIEYDVIIGMESVDKLINWIEIKLKYKTQQAITEFLLKNSHIINTISDKYISQEVRLYKKLM